MTCAQHTAQGCATLLWLSKDTTVPAASKGERGRLCVFQKLQKGIEGSMAGLGFFLAVLWQSDRMFFWPRVAKPQILSDCKRRVEIKLDYFCG